MRAVSSKLFRSKGITARTLTDEERDADVIGSKEIQIHVCFDLEARKVNPNMNHESCMKYFRSEAIVECIGPR